MDRVRIGKGVEYHWNHLIEAYFEKHHPKNPMGRNHPHRRNDKARKFDRDRLGKIFKNGKYFTSKKLGWNMDIIKNYLVSGKPNTPRNKSKKSYERRKINSMGPREPSKLII